MAGEIDQEGGAAGEHVDLHIACLACPVLVRELYWSTATLIGGLAELPMRDDFARALVAQGAAVRLALLKMRPFVEAHVMDQEHAYAPELEEARSAPPLWPMRRSELLCGLLHDVEWGLRMLTESATPQALDVPRLLMRVRDRLVKAGVF